MSELQYTTVDRVLAKFHRDLKGTDINESDAIEWIGEALDLLKVAQTQEQAVAFIEVKNHQADLPQGFQMVLQLARDNNWTKQDKECCTIPTEVIQEINEACHTCDTHPANAAGYPVPLDCNGEMIGDYEVAYYRPFFDLKWEYQPWVNSSYYQERFTPIRPSSNVFFNSLVCKEKDQTPYSSCTDEYSIVGTLEKKLRFSFKEGYVALAYMKTATDRETGYPLVPDNQSCRMAITYFIKWMIAQHYSWNGRQGFDSKAQEEERKWNKYARQFKNYMKMPKSIDDFQDLLEQSHYLIPRQKRYYGFFGNLNKAEDRRFNDPDYRNRYRHGR